MVAEWLKHSTANGKVAGLSPTIAIGDLLSLLGVDSALPPNMSRCGVSPEIVHTASFGGDVKPLVPGDLVQ